MIKTKHRYTNKGVTAECLGSRIRRMINTKIMEPMDGEQIFDDQPNAPTKSMDVNPIYDFNNDSFDLVESMHMEAVALSNKAEDRKSSADGQTESAGAEHTEQSEVND